MFADKTTFIALLLVISSQYTQTFVLLTANLEDVKKIARQFMSDPLAEKIADLIYKATNGQVAATNDVSAENEENADKDGDSEIDIYEPHANQQRHFASTEANTTEPNKVKNVARIKPTEFNRNSRFKTTDFNEVSHTTNKLDETNQYKVTKIDKIIRDKEVDTKNIGRQNKFDAIIGYETTKFKDVEPYDTNKFDEINRYETTDNEINRYETTDNEINRYETTDNEVSSHKTNELEALNLFTTTEFNRYKKNEFNKASRYKLASDVTEESFTTSDNPFEIIGTQVEPLTTPEVEDASSFILSKNKLNRGQYIKASHYRGGHVSEEKFEDLTTTRQRRWKMKEDVEPYLGNRGEQSYELPYYGGGSNYLMKKRKTENTSLKTKNVAYGDGDKELISKEFSNAPRIYERKEFSNLKEHALNYRERDLQHNDRNKPKYPRSELDTSNNKQIQRVHETDHEIFDKHQKSKILGVNVERHRWS